MKYKTLKRLQELKPLYLKGSPKETANQYRFPAFFKVAGL